MTFVEILSSFVTFVMVIISMFLMRFLRTKISDNTWESLKFWVNETVEAAEQLFKMQEKAGEEKYAYVSAVLDELQLNLGETEKSVLIEAAVSRLSAGKKLD